MPINYSITPDRLTIDISGEDQHRLMSRIIRVMVEEEAVEALEILESIDDAITRLVAETWRLRRTLE